MTNEFVFAYTFFTFPPKFSNPSAVDPANISGYTDHKIWSPDILPQIPNLVSWSCNQGGTNGCFPHVYAPGMTTSFNGGGFGNRKSVPSIADNFAKVLGSHTMKFGFYLDMSAQAQTSAYGSWGQGMYIFDNWTGNSTGNYLADFLIGHGQYTQTQQVPVVDVRYKTIALYGQDQWKATRKLTLTYGLRFDHLGQWYPTGKHPGSAVWDSSLYDNSSTAQPYSGMTWHDQNSSIPVSGWESRWSFSPRVGAAYDMFGNGKTVLRGGFGVYPWQVTTNDIGGTYLVPLGFRTVTTGALNGLAAVGDYTPGALGAFNGDSSFALKKGDNKIPYTQNWNFIISQQVPWHSTVEIQYAGNRSRDALLTGNGSNPNFIASLNKIPLGALWGPDPITGDPCPANAAAGLTCDPDKWSDSQIQHFRPYQNYGKALIEVTHGSYSNYHALMMGWQKTSGWATFSTNYTFSKLLGIRDGQTNNGNGNGTNMSPFNIRDNYSVLAYDHTHLQRFLHLRPTQAHPRKPVPQGPREWMGGCRPYPAAERTATSAQHCRQSARQPAGEQPQDSGHRYESPGHPDAVSHLRSAQRPEQRAVLQPQLLRGAGSSWRERTVRLALHQRSRVCQQRPFPLQELQGRRETCLAVSLFGLQLPQPPVAPVRENGRHYHAV
jgi:hypothetical protein